MAPQDYHYSGEELYLFSKAENWKKYFSAAIKPFITGSVLEAGAGLGKTSPYLINEKVTRWTYLEPDPNLAKKINSGMEESNIGIPASIINGTIANIPVSELYDTILYIDVLEHIEKDQLEINLILQKLAPNGRLIILAPAYNSLMNNFDRAIGHYRRYDKKMLRNLIKNSLSEIKLFYLESTGIGLLWVNKILSRKKYPTQKEVLIWDRLFVPVSRFADKFFRYRFGKTIIGVWQKNSTA